MSALLELPEDTLRFEILPYLAGREVSILSRTCKKLMPLLSYLTELHVTDVPVEALDVFQHLSTLHIAFSRSTFVCLKPFYFRELTIEALGGTKVTVSKGTEHSRTLKLIGNVVICDTEVCNASSLEIVATGRLAECIFPYTAFPNLKSVRIEGCSTQVLPESVLPTIEKLHLTRARCGVGKFPKLRELTVDDWGTEAIPAAKRVPALEVLRLSNTLISSKKLSQYRNLRQLHLNKVKQTQFFIRGTLSRLEVLSVRDMSPYTVLKISPTLQQLKVIFVRSPLLAISPTLEEDFPNTHVALGEQLIRSEEASVTVYVGCSMK